MADSERNRSTEDSEYDRKHQDRFDPNAGNTGTGTDAAQQEEPQPGDSSDANENK